MLSSAPAKVGILGLALAILAAALLAANGNGEPDARAERIPQVVATTGILADIVSQVGGDDVEVMQLVPDGASPHSYAPSAQEQQRLAEADLVAFTSTALEQGLPLEVAGNTFELAENIDGERTFAKGELSPLADEHEGDGGADEHEGEHRAGSVDPHLWLDPTQVRAAIPALSGALAALDPTSSTDFRERGKDYVGQLSALDREVEAMTGSIPAERRKLVTSHDSMGYFADRYGFEFVGAPFALVPESEASAADLSGLIDSIEREQVPVVFAQEGDDPEVLERIAEEAGVEVVDDLRISSPAESGSYIEMMGFTARRITESLSG